MPPRRVVCPQTASLLDWSGPSVAEGFAPGTVKAATLEGKLCRALRIALTDSGRDRAEIASAMTDWLGDNADDGGVSKSMLDAYTAEGRRTHTINAIRLAALCAVTEDIRPLALLLEELGYAVVEPRYVHIVRAVMLEEQAARLQQAAALERRAAR